LKTDVNYPDYIKGDLLDLLKKLLIKKPSKRLGVNGSE